MGHPIHKHMHTHITKQNVAAAIRDDKAHMDYLKRDVKDDQKFHVADKDARQTHDEQHISNLAQDVKHDEKKEGMSRMQSPLNKEGGKTKHGYLGSIKKYNKHIINQQHHTNPDAPRNEQDPTSDKNKAIRKKYGSPVNVGPDPSGSSSTPKKKEYSFGEKVVGTAKNVGNYAAAGASKFLNMGSGYSKGGGSQPMDRGGIAAQNRSDMDRAKSFQVGHLSSAKKRRDEGSAFFRGSSSAHKSAAGMIPGVGQERKDLNKDNPVVKDASGKRK